MAQKPEERGVGTGIVVGGIGGTMLGATIMALLAAKPAEAAPPEDKLNYLIECLTTLVPVLAEVAESNAQLIALLQQWLAAQGLVPPAEGMEVTVSTPWVAKEPEEIFSQAILSADTFYTDKMVDWRRGKRIYFFVQSTLNEDVEIQVIGNMTDSKEGATDISVAHTCTKNDNISIGPAWDDWCPYIGIKITTAVAPISGLLTISAVRQE